MHLSATMIIPAKYWKPAHFRTVLKIIRNYQNLSVEQLPSAEIFNDWARSVKFDIGSADIRPFPAPNRPSDPPDPPSPPNPDPDAFGRTRGRTFSDPPDPPSPPIPDPD